MFLYIYTLIFPTVCACICFVQAVGLFIGVSSSCSSLDTNSRGRKGIENEIYKIKHYEHIRILGRLILSVWADFNFILMNVSMLIDATIRFLSASSVPRINISFQNTVRTRYFLYSWRHGALEMIHDVSIQCRVFLLHFLWSAVRWLRVVFRK